jgi:hypothetical protein
MSTVPYRAGVTGPDFLYSTGEHRGSKRGPVTIIFRRMTDGFMKLPLTASYGCKCGKKETQLI